MQISKGNPLLMGSQKVNRSYNFSYACTNDNITLLIFDSKAEQVSYRIQMDATYKTGDVFSCKIGGVSLDKCYYGYEVNGRMRIDPYAKTITDCEEFGIEKEQPQYLSRIVLDHYDWEEDEPLRIPYEDCIFYKMNVRGFTKSRTSGVHHKGTFAGIIEKIPYLKELGITTIELMPCYEFDEMQRFPDISEESILSIYSSGPIRTPVNYWGYVKGYHFAPKASFTSIAGQRSDYTVEFKRMVKTLHRNGIEVVMEMYFEGETPDRVIDCLRYWVREYHIDGIHLYADAASLAIAADDPLLSRTKIITVYWEGHSKNYKNIGNSNEGFAITAKRFLKGDEDQLSSFVNIERANPVNSANVNYITSHNGFTLMDLVSYDRKHNDANGENNRDGENYNYSWNCGVEGKSRKRKVMELRQKQIKNAFFILLLAQGTPLILAGDEFENSQGGNNNPYCIDSETSWLNWKSAGQPGAIFTFVKELIAFRMSRRILHMPKQLLAYDQAGCGYPDISYHGSSAWYTTMENYERHIGIMYCSRYAKQDEEEDELIYVAYNLHWETHELALPNVAQGCQWEVIMSSLPDEKKLKITDNRMIRMEPRSIAVLTGKIRPYQKN